MHLLKIINYMHRKNIRINMKVTLALIDVFVHTLVAITQLALRTIYCGKQIHNQQTAKQSSQYKYACMTESAISTKAFYMHFIPFKIEFKHDLNHIENFLYKIVSRILHRDTNGCTISSAFICNWSQLKMIFRE